MKNNTWYTSIVAIVLAFIIFWPIGCILLYLRWVQYGGSYKAVSNILALVGIFLLLFGGLCLLTFEDASEFFSSLIVLVVPGAICVYIWQKRRKKFIQYDKYLSYINVRRKIKLDKLCDDLNVDSSSAIATLTEMINKKVLNAYLTDDELVLSNSNAKSDATFVQDTSEESKKKETKVVKCKECGAKNTVTVGEASECEYCGSALN